ncbi:MAG: hypothetical protein JJE07_03880 [Flavobacteriaceae bacterium]|nr:hypothetical protein [Flavobacteriaceae bacterium]
MLLLQPNGPSIIGIRKKGYEDHLGEATISNIKFFDAKDELFANLKIQN